MQEQVVRVEREVVGDDDLLDETPEDQITTFVELLKIEAPWFFDLRQEGRRPHDRPGDQMREERDEGGELDEVARWFGVASIDVDHIAHRLERIERNADRQNYVEMPMRALDPHLRQHRFEAVDEEIRVLEIAEHSQIERHAQGDERFALSLIFNAIDRHAAEVIHHGREDQKPEEPPIPTRVEIVARGEQNQVLNAQPTAGRPIYREEDREEISELKSIKEHASISLPFSTASLPISRRCPR